MLHLLRTNSDNPDFRRLIEQLDQELWARYDIKQAAYAAHNKIENNPTVVVAYMDQKPVGCACFKPFAEDTVEIKRMFVDADQRGKGIAYAILSELEAWAKELGFTKAVLETGNKQPEAVHLYQKAGYTPMEKYGPYVELDNSICMKKLLVEQEVGK